MIKLINIDVDSLFSVLHLLFFDIWGKTEQSDISRDFMIFHIQQVVRQAKCHINWLKLAG